MPVLFQTFGVPAGRVLAVLFFLCLSFAGLTSLISNMEQTAVTLDDFGMARKCSVPITVIAIFLVGLMSAFNINILTNQDFVWGFALVISGMMLWAMVIYYGTSNFRSIIVNDYGLNDWKLPRIWEYIIKFLAPIEALLLIVWWAVEMISGGTEPGADQWYEFGRETFMAAIVQWLAVLIVVAAIKRPVVCVCNHMRTSRLVVCVRNHMRTSGSDDKGLQLSSTCYPTDEFDSSYGSSAGKSLEIHKDSV